MLEPMPTHIEPELHVPMRSRHLELMSPAGDWGALHAAIEAGADAVYFGLRHFSARAKVGFTLDELPAAVEKLHARGVQAFVTFNTLVFDHEFDAAGQAVTAMAHAGVDAVIVQDLGVARWIHANAPGLNLHGSTQMSITSSQGAELARSVGCSRVVLGRELSLRDIEQIAQQTDIELEVFVHGALCVSYSGQCFSSEAWGGRSANRGQCAQACRMDYQLIVDGQIKDLGPYRYLLSPGDLCAIDQIPELLRIGVSCVKIEGRYKDADYVALVTHAYRQAIDAALAGAPRTIDPAERMELEQVYSRGLGPHFITGTNHQQVVIGRAPRHRGLRVGRVVLVDGLSIEIEAEHPIFRGDGLVFDAAERRSPAIAEQGGFVFDVRATGPGRVRLEFANDKVNTVDIAPGDWVWRTHDPRLTKKARRWTQASSPVYLRPVTFCIRAQVGQPLFIEAAVDAGPRATWRDVQPIATARKHATDIATIRQQLSRLGGTPFRLDHLDCELDEGVFIPTSTLNTARRALVEDLLAHRRAPRRIAVRMPDHPPQAAIPSQPNSVTHPRLHVLVRTPRQLEAALPLRPDSITLDYLELYGLRESVETIRAAGIEVRVASPRILKPAEQNIVRFLLSLDCSLVIRSGGLLWELTHPARLSPHRIIADFSLNAANRLSTQALLDCGADVITPTHDMDAQQISELAAQVNPRHLEVIVYQHLPIFHTEHCVFCRFLSSGTDRSNCGQPCERHEVAVRDGAGRRHPVLADVGCRNTVFNAPIQSGARHLQSWLAADLRDFRLEFVHQRAADVTLAVETLRQFFTGTLNAADLDLIWSRTSPAGTTEGSLQPAPRQLVQLI